MNGDKEYYLKETYRHLALTYIGIPDANRKQLDKVIDCLNKYNKMLENERIK